MNGFSLEYVTHDDAVAAIAGIVEQYNEITLKIGKVTQFTVQDESSLKYVLNYTWSFLFCFFIIYLLKYLFPLKNR